MTTEMSGWCYRLAVTAALLVIGSVGFSPSIPAFAGTVCDPVNPQNCAKPTKAGGLPVTPTTSAAQSTVVVGTQTNVSLASATTLTIPTGATAAYITVECSVIGTNGWCARWRDDGTNPTASAGQPMAPGDSLTYGALTLPIVLIAASGATATFTASYYK